MKAFSVNFRDSKEIMMTSDSENKFKYSSSRVNRTSSIKYIDTLTTTPLKPEASQRIAVTTEIPVNVAAAVASCALHQLRCISGKCITVDQLCDKVMFYIVTFSFDSFNFVST